MRFESREARGGNIQNPKTMGFSASAESTFPYPGIRLPKIGSVDETSHDNELNLKAITPEQAFSRRLEIWNLGCDSDLGFMRGIAIKLLMNGHKNRVLAMQSEGKGSLLENAIVRPFKRFNMMRIHNMALDALLNGDENFIKAIGKDFFDSLKDDEARTYVAMKIADKLRA